MAGAFCETPRFPDDLAVWAKTGVGWSNQVTTVKSGREQRNQVWTYPKARFDIAHALRVVALQGEGAASYNIALVRNWIIAMSGQQVGFRFKDASDWKDETFGIFTPLPDSTTTVFQMLKSYTIGAFTATRLIAKPVSATVTVFDNGSTVTPTVDYTTGKVTFSVAPTTGHTLTWTGQFDIPVRFAVDMLDWALDPTAGLYTLETCPLLEIRI